MATNGDPPHVTDPGEVRRLVREGYDRASHAYRGDDADLEMSGYGHWLRRLAARVPEGSRVLDLGCGNGALLDHLQQTRGCTGYGVEIDDANVLACV